MSKILVLYINNIIHTVIARARAHIFIFNTQFSFAVKTIKVIPGRKVRSTHPVYIYIPCGKKRRVYPIILNAGRTRSRHTCPGSTIKSVSLLREESRRVAEEGVRGGGNRKGVDSRGDVLGHVPREILSDIYAKVPTNVCSWMDPPSGGFDLFRTESAGILRAAPSPRCGTSSPEVPLLPWSEPRRDETVPPCLLATPREIFETQSWIKISSRQFEFTRVRIRCPGSLPPIDENFLWHVETLSGYVFLSKGFFWRATRSLRLYIKYRLSIDVISSTFCIVYIQPDAFVAFCMRTWNNTRESDWTQHRRTDCSFTKRNWFSN